MKEPHHLFSVYALALVNICKLQSPYTFGKLEILQ